MKKIIRFVFLFLIVSTLSVLVACDGNEEVLPKSLNITEESIEIEVGQDIAVNVVLENLEGNIQWEVSDASVASVSGKVVTGLKVGETIIKAKIGEYEDSCSVKVIAPSSVGTLSVDYESISLNQGSKLSVNATVTYKGEKVEGLVYEWTESSNSTVVTLNPTGSKCEVNATGFGASTVTVKTTHLGVELIKTLSVTVIRDVSVEIENLTLGESGYNLSLVTYVPEGMENEVISEFEPIVKAYVNGDEVSIGEYALETAGDAVVIEGNKIKANKAGNAVVTLTYEDESGEIDLVINVTVSTVNVNIAQIIDFDKDANLVVLDKEQFLGNVTSVRLGDEELTYEVAEGKLRISGYKEANVGETSLVITTDVSAYNLKALVVTMVIDSKADLDRLGTVSKVGTAVWDGYFVLGCDIEYNGVFNTFCGELQGGTWGGTTGFVGTFDGRGYVIKGFKTAGAFGGLFGTIGNTGVVKNVGFVDAEIKDSADRSGIVAAFVYGKIQNVFVEVKQYGAWWCGGVAEYVFPNGEISNSVVYVTETNNRADILALASFSFDTAIFKDCYSVGTLPLYRTGGDNPVYAEETDDLRNFASLEAFKNANVDLSSWDTTIWDTSSGMPVFKGYLKYQESEPTHEHELCAECGKCLKADCPEEKCAGHVQEPTHEHELCAECGKCLKTDCPEDKCEGHQPTIEKTDIVLSNVVDFELGTAVVAELANDTVVKVLINGEEVAFIQNGSTITLTGEVALGDYTLEIIGTTSDYAGKASVVTKVIKSVTDWKAVLDARTTTITGYYVLGADLDYTGVAYGIVNGLAWGATEGFDGIFDGRGHTISNLALEGDQCSYFGTICLNAVIRNVEFTNASIAWGGQGGILGNMVYGRIENVSISFSSNGGWWTGAIGCFIRSEARINNVMIYVTGTDSDNKSGIGSCIQDASVITNCYVVGNLPLAYVGADAPGAVLENGTNVAKYADLVALVAAGHNFSSFDTTVWNLEGGYPYFGQEAPAPLPAPEKTDVVLNHSVDFETANLTAVVAELANDTVTQVLINGEEVAFTQDGSTLTLSGVTLELGDYTLEIIGTKSDYTGKAGIVTKVIKSVADWKAVLDSRTTTITGYYVLGADLDYTGVSYAKVTGLAWGATEGFDGIFDGRGHTISNLALEGDQCSYFGTICLNAVIRNVEFTNASIAWGGQGGILGNMVYGRIENVSISFSSNGGWWTGAIGCFIRSEARINNVMIYVTGTDSDNKSGIGSCVQDASVITNCYVIGNLPLAYVGPDSPASVLENSINVAKYADLDTLKAAGHDFASFNATVWNLDSGYPVLR